jgi:hypothetical protein
MPAIETLENAVKSLSPTELARFRQRFADFDSAAWDAQIEADAGEGKLDNLAREALAEYKNGTTREL